MTRKDYVLIAAALAATRPSLDQHTTTSAVGNNTFVNNITFSAAYEAWKSVRRNIAWKLKHDNPLFDGRKFYEATEV